MLEKAAIQENKWTFRVWLHGEFHTGLKFQPGFQKKSSWNQIVVAQTATIWFYEDLNIWKNISCNRNEILAWAKKQETIWLPPLTKQKRFQWNKGDKLENVITCPSNFKDQMEYKNIDFSADKVKQYEAVREAMNSASLKTSLLSMQVRLSSWEIPSQRQVSFQFHHSVGCHHPKKLKSKS